MRRAIVHRTKTLQIRSKESSLRGRKKRQEAGHDGREQGQDLKPKAESERESKSSLGDFASELWDGLE